MKVKRFENIWTMGLILCVGLLLAFYIIKLIFPHWIVGVAETPNIIAFGEYVDAHLWANTLFHFLFSFAICYLYVCACVRQRKLDRWQVAIMCAFIVLSIFLKYVNSDLNVPYNYVLLVLMPFVIAWQSDILTEKTFTSTAICFSIDVLSQALSAKIRDVFALASYINSATITILLVDVVIWRVILYFYFNFKRKEN